MHTAHYARPANRHTCWPPPSGFRLSLFVSLCLWSVSLPTWPDSSGESIPRCHSHSKCRSPPSSAADAFKTKKSRRLGCMSSLHHGHHLRHRHLSSIQCVRPRDCDDSVRRSGRRTCRNQCRGQNGALNQQNDGPMAGSLGRRPTDTKMKLSGQDSRASTASGPCATACAPQPLATRERQIQLLVVKVNIATVSRVSTILFPITFTVQIAMALCFDGRAPEQSQLGEISLLSISCRTVNYHYALVGLSCRFARRSASCNRGEAILCIGHPPIECRN